jgi:two-component system, response regulator RegA
MSAHEPNLILLADDDTSFATGALSALGTSGRKVQTLSSATALIAALKSTSPRVWRLVFEPNLPGTSWYSLLKRVTELVPALRVVVLTSFASEALFDCCRELRVRAALPKPSSPAWIVELLQAVEDDDPDPLVQPLELSPGLAQVEWEYINLAVRRAEGHITEASRFLGLPRQTLYRKLRKHPSWHRFALDPESEPSLLCPPPSQLSARRLESTIAYLSRRPRRCHALGRPALRSRG